MIRWPLTLVLVGFVAMPAAALADQKSDCMKGVAMIKTQLKRKHPQPVLDQLQKALEGAQMEIAENDWPECLDYIGAARKALQR
jgi:hypothetical protein